MRVALILATSIEKSPYVQYYIDIYERMGADIEIILLNRDKKVIKRETLHRIYSCDIVARETAPGYRKVYDYIRYSRFVQEVLGKSSYDQVVVFTIANALFLSPYLLKYYRGRYIFDIRDYSPLVGYSGPVLRRLLKNSSLNVLSSPGFRAWLPKCESVICHNVRPSFLADSVGQARDIDCRNIVVLTIGQLRDYETNRWVMESLGDKPAVRLQFSGKGIACESLEQYKVEQGYNNVSFTGYYHKSDELSIVDGCDFMNIVLPDDKLSRHLLSNRFYLALLRRKPMLVSEGSIQAEYVKKFGLGIVISAEDNIFDKIIAYARLFDPHAFEQNCNRLLQQVKVDTEDFSKRILDSSIV